MTDATYKQENTERAKLSQKRRLQSDKQYRLKNQRQAKLSQKRRLQTDKQYRLKKQLQAKLSQKKDCRLTNNTGSKSSCKPNSTKPINEKHLSIAERSKGNGTNKA